MLPPSIIFLGFILPAILVGAALLWGPRWLGAAAVSGAFALAFWKVREAPGWPPVDVFAWIFYFAVTLGLLGVADELLAPPIWVEAAVLVIVLRLMLRTLLGRLAPQSLSNTELEQAIDLTTLIAAAWWIGLEQLARLRPGFVAPVALVILSAGTAVLLYCWGTALEAQLAATLFGVSVAATAASFFPRCGGLPRGVAGTIGMILILKLTHAWFYSPDPFSPAEQIYAGVFLISPLLAFAGDLPGIARRRASGRVAVRLIAVLLAVAAASALTVRDYQKANQDTQQDE
jgi:hypothetical protein